MKKPMPTDEPTTPPQPIAASTDSKKARAKKAAAKEPISYILLIWVTCSDKNIVESSMECLQELESTFDYGKELQKQRAVVAVKLREIKAPQSTLRLESRAEVVVEGRGNTA